MEHEFEEPTVWDHVYFWTKEVVILGGIVAFITVSVSALFFLPDHGSNSSELLTFILS